MHEYYEQEYCRQLRMQEKQINQMTTGQFDKAQEDFAANGRLNDQGNYKPQLTPGYIDELTSQGVSLSDARKAAEIAAPLHNPDQAWGNSIVNALGDPNVNKSIGASAPSRIAELKDQLKKDNAPKDSKLNVRLCAQKDGKEVC